MRICSIILALLFGLLPVVADAQVPPATLERISDIRVEIAALLHQTKIGTLTYQEYSRRADVLKKEETALWNPYRRLPSDEQTRARSTVAGLAQTKLSVLSPQWQKEEQEFRNASREQRREQSAAPSAPPAPAAPPNQSSTNTLNLYQDAKLAAAVLAKKEENEIQFEKKLIAIEAYRDTSTSLDAELERLHAPYQARNQQLGRDFRREYTELAAELIQAVRLKYAVEKNGTQPAPPSADNQAASSSPPAPAPQVRTPQQEKDLKEFEERLRAPTETPGERVSGFFGGLVNDFRAALAKILPWAVGIGVIGFGIYWMATAKARASAQLDSKWRAISTASNQDALGKFGATQEERTAKIDDIFDKRAVSLAIRINDPPDLTCHISRALSGMSPREREALRTSYHLFNLGLLDPYIFYTTRRGLIYGDGSGTVTDYKFRPYPNANSITDMIRLKIGAMTAESVIDTTLRNLNSVLAQNPDSPVLKKLSARLFGDGGDMNPGAPLRSAPKGELPEAALILGLDENNPRNCWYFDGDGSLITVAPPGAGKTQSQVFPNLLTWKGPAVVLDVKGEIYEQTSKWRRENVGPVYKFSPLDPAAGHCFNPLTLVRSDPEYLWEDSRFLADMMIVPTGAKDPFWENRARDVLTAAIARTCLEEDVDKRPMADVIDILHGVGWTKFVAYLRARIDIRSMSRAGHSFAEMEQKTRDGVLQSALSSTSAWNGERISRATRKSDWSPLDLRSGQNPTIYMCLKPNEIDSYISVLRVFIAQHIRALTGTLPPRDAHPILFVLDELPRLKHMPPVEEALEIGRQYGLKLWMFTQSLGQLENAYPNAEGMVGSCAIRMFMNPSLHDETAQKISDDIGFQDSVIDGSRVKIVEPNVLAGPDFKDSIIVMAANAKAARLKKYFAYEDESLTGKMGSL
jgi:type IV secretion system protein VirD4